MPYIGNTIRAADDYRLIDDISSSFNGSTTSFALQVAGSAPVPFPKSPQQVLISVNGVIQEPDPTGASGFNLVGTNIVFSSAPTNGHAFFGIIYATADYLNAGGNFPSGSLGAPSLTFIGDENTGLYRKSGGSVGFVSDATEIANFDSNGITISSGNLILGDSSGASSDRIVLGAGSDLSILHDGSNSFIDNNTNDLVIRCDGDDLKLLAEDDIVLRDNDDSTNFIQCINGGAVELFHNGSKKAETASGGFTVTGTLTATTLAGTLSTAAQTNVTSLGTLTGLTLSGDMTFTGDSANIVFDKSTDDLIFNDGAKAIFGTSSDGIEIYHASNESFIDDQGTGNLFIRSNGAGIHLKKHGTTETLAKFNTDGNNEFYFDNSKKAETVTGGFTITGTCTATAFAGDGSALTGVGGTTINNNANNRIITGSGTANTLEGESTLTYNGSGTLEIGDSGSAYILRGAGVTKHELGASASDNDLVIQNNKDAGNVTSDIIFKGSGSGGATVSEKMRITTTGVGINHNTSGTSSNAALTISNRTSSTATRFNLVNSGSSSVESTQIFSQNNELAFTASGSEKLRILNGGGITFNGDTATANALDDYEEGTFSATVVGGSSVTQIFDQTGRYTKIGNFVHIQALAQFSGVGNGATVFLSLPFNHVTSTALGGGVISFTNVAGLSGESCLTIVGQSGVNYVRVKNKTADPTISGTQSNKAIYYHFAYQVA